VVVVGFDTYVDVVVVGATVVIVVVVEFDTYVVDVVVVGFDTYSLPSEKKGCHNDKNIVSLAGN